MLSYLRNFFTYIILAFYITFNVTFPVAAAQDTAVKTGTARFDNKGYQTYASHQADSSYAKRSYAREDNYRTENLSGLSRAAKIIESKNDLRIAAGEIAADMAQSYATDKINNWLSFYGTSRFKFNFKDKFKFSDVSFDLLLPFYDSKSFMVFLQTSANHDEGRDTNLNFGLGSRLFFTHSMFGLNSFFDYNHIIDA